MIKGVRLKLFRGWAPFPDLNKVTWHNLFKNLFVKHGRKNKLTLLVSVRLTMQADGGKKSAEKVAYRYSFMDKTL